MTKNTLDRFKEKYVVDEKTGCWLWVAAIRGGGYGSFFQNYKQYVAHRWSYQHHRGEIPGDMQLDHLCRTRHCVNPDHLEPVTCQENILRGNGLAAENSKKTHCRNGHVLSGANLYIYKNERGCRTCRRANHTRWERKMKAGGNA